MNVILQLYLILNFALIASSVNGPVSTFHFVTYDDCCTSFAVTCQRANSSLAFYFYSTASYFLTNFTFSYLIMAQCSYCEIFVLYLDVEFDNKILGTGQRTIFMVLCTGFPLKAKLKTVEYQITS